MSRMGLGSIQTPIQQTLVPTNANAAPQHENYHFLPLHVEYRAYLQAWELRLPE